MPEPVTLEREETETAAARPVSARKSYTTSVELKATAEGAFRATIATYNVIDKDGDVTLPGAFTEGERVKVAAWGHNWMALPVGSATVGQDKTRAWVDGEFFLDTTHGLDTYRTVKRLADQQEWSYGFDVLDAEYGVFEGKDVRFLKKLRPFEASPVMVGAGENTRTDFIKSDKPTGLGLTFEEHSDHVRVAVEEWAERAKAGSAARLKEGRPQLSDSRRARMSQVLDALQAVFGELDGLLKETEPQPKQADEPVPPRVVGGVDLGSIKALLPIYDARYGAVGETTHA